MKIPTMDLARLPWRKSAHSGDASNCVELTIIPAEKPADDDQ